MTSSIVFISIGIIILIILFVLKTHYGNANDRIKKELQIHYANNTNFIIINLDDVIVEDFSHSESVPVDVYDKELNPNDDSIYYNPHQSFRDKLHKYKNVTKHTSLLIIPFEYEGSKYKFKIKLPVNAITIRMGFYRQKTT